MSWWLNAESGPKKPSEQRICDVHTTPERTHAKACCCLHGSVLGAAQRMAPGSSSEAHEHHGDEEFFVIEGSLRDNDGTIYKTGDLVLLKDGTQHFSVSDDGCLLAVYIPKAETNL